MYCTHSLYTQKWKKFCLSLKIQSLQYNFFNLPILKEFQHIVVVFLYFNKKEMHISKICLLYYVAYKYLDFFQSKSFCFIQSIIFLVAYISRHVVRSLGIIICQDFDFYEEGIDIQIISMQIFLVQKQPFKSFNKQNTFLLNCHIRVVPLKLDAWPDFPLKFFLA